ncbi:MAG: hypothetical protein AAYR33_07320 [Acetobacteraceae bacterium]
MKSANIDVATLIRASLTDQLAVQDMIVLAEVLLLPQDDLKLATVLTSPLGDLSDESLMALAAGRGQESYITVKDGAVDVSFMTVSGASYAPAIAAAKEERVKAMREESHLLLYVALTRAKDWLVIADGSRAKKAMRPMTVRSLRRGICAITNARGRFRARLGGADPHSRNSAAAEN